HTPPRSTLFPYTTLFRSIDLLARLHDGLEPRPAQLQVIRVGGQRPPDVRHAVDLFRRLDVLKDRPHLGVVGPFVNQLDGAHRSRSEEHTSEVTFRSRMPS